MPHFALALAVPMASLFLFTGPPQGKSRIGSLDPSHAFYHPSFASKPKLALATLGDQSITVETYLRYLANRYGTEQLRELAFDLALKKECGRRGLLKSAPVLARGTAAARMHESGRDAKSDPDGSLQRKFANEALRELRIDTLVRADRQNDEKAQRRLFDRRYGVDGQRVTVRQILVSFRGTRRRSGDDKPTDDEIRATALARAKTLRTRLVAGTELHDLLRESDDRQTRAALRDPKRTARAGILEGYNYTRYGAGFAAAVRALAVGAVSKPVESSLGFHVIALLDRRTTAIGDVTEALRRELGRGKATRGERRTLRIALLKQHGYTETASPR